jgi:hypothetical protein
VRIRLGTVDLTTRQPPLSRRRALGIFRQRDATLADLQASEYRDLHQIQEDSEGGCRSKRAGYDPCRQRRHGDAADG